MASTRELLISPHDFKKDGTPSKMRAHAGNVPVLPQDKFCHHDGCSARFTRTTHLNRHLRTHLTERTHHCDTCPAQFTRSDLLTRHKRGCNNSSRSRPRRKSCKSCSEAKTKCDLDTPQCGKCLAKGKECIFDKPVDDVRHINTSRSIPTVTYVSTREPYYPPQSFPVSSHLHQTLPQHSFTSESAPASRDIYDQAHGASLTSPSAVRISCLRDDFLPPPSGGHLALVPVANHPSTVYTRGDFGSLLNGIFPDPLPQTTDIQEEGQWASESPGQADTSFDALTDYFPIPENVFNAFGDFPLFMQTPSVVPAFRDARLSITPPNTNGFNLAVPFNELQHYLSLFISVFCKQMPVVHCGTFEWGTTPPFLLRAMQACGALFMRTRKANAFVTETLMAAREVLKSEFSKTDRRDHVPLVVSCVLLQTIGLFHQKTAERDSSSIYHGMIVRMIRRSGLLAHNNQWEPLNPNEVTIDTIWRDWAVHEMTKRALLLSYLHDCCHCIYFALRPSYHPEELQLYLPCEDSLWTANTAEEWFLILQTPSAYGSYHTRLTGISLQHSLAQLKSESMANIIPLSPMAHFILIHSVLRSLFTICVESRPVFDPNSTPIHVDQGAVNREIIGVQYMLHHWFSNWMVGPDRPKKHTSVLEEPPFTSHAIPFYWLGHIALLAHKEGLPPFEHNSRRNLLGEVRFRLIKQWLRHIRKFLIARDDEPTIFWDKLMRMRLQAWEIEVTGEDDGLLGFFPDL